MNLKISLQSYYSRIFFLRTELDRLLTSSILFSCLLVVARIIYTGWLTYASLVWNLFLAFVPYFITVILKAKPRLIEKKIVFSIFFFCWLLFIPNSFYIITDLFHLADHHRDRQVPNWFDLSMIVSFAWNGLLLGILSIRQMEKIAQQHLAYRQELFFLYPIMWLNALGIYVGRYLRYNSWDIVINPFDLLYDITNILMHPLAFRYAWGMIFCFSILMTFMYLTLKKISRAIR